MAATTTLNELKQNAAPPALSSSELSIFSEAGSKLMWSMAQAYASSTIVPESYQDQKSNCFIALDMARRLDINPLTVMQQLYIVHGRPAWSAQFLIGMFNNNPNFSPLRFKFEGKEGTDGWGCRALAIEKETGEVLEGTLITIGLAKDEGWYDKKGSKWKTMAEQMLRYRAAAWFIRAYAPEQGMGLMSREEIIDMDQDDDGIYRMTTDDIQATVTTTEPEPQPAPGPAPGKPEKPVAPEPTKDEPWDGQSPPTMPPNKTAKGKPADSRPSESKDLYSSPPSTVPCPNQNDKPVDEMDCAGCKSREGCPSWA